MNDLKRKNKIVFTGNFEEYAGYAYANRKFVKELYDRGWDMGVEMIPCNRELPIEDLKFYYSLRNFANGRPSLYHFQDHKKNQNIVKVVFWLPMASIPKYKHNISYTMMESREASPDMIRIMNTFYDSVIVPTEYYKEAFIYSGLEIDCKVVPIGIDEIYNRKNIREDAKFNFKVFIKGKETFVTDKKPDKKDDRFNFLSVSRWSYRKGFDCCIKAFLKEFKDDDGVTLILAIRHSASSSEQRFKDAVEEGIRQLVEENGTEKSPPIYWIWEDIPFADMPSMYALGDVFVLCSRGEGESMPTLEASMMGLPSIIPLHTGFSDYATKRNCFPINIDSWIKYEDDPGWFPHVIPQFKGQYFSKFGDSVVEQVAAYMRDAKDHWIEAVVTNYRMVEDIKEKYSWKRCTDLMEERLLEIVSQ